MMFKLARETEVEGKQTGETPIRCKRMLLASQPMQSIYSYISQLQRIMEAILFIS